MLTIPRRAAVATALREAGGEPVSGEVLAARLGISRVAVSKHVAALRGLGYDIASAPRAGYRLLAAPEACIPEEVAPRLADPLWVSCTGGLEVGSTNDEAKRLARAGAPEGTLVVAAAQGGGRGRFGRSWSSPVGGVYASFIVRPALPPAAASALPLVIALGAARALRDLGVPVGVKWPNDLFAEGCKLAGILLEMAAETDRVEWVVAGVGVNVLPPAQPDSIGVRSFAQTDVPEVAAAVLDGAAVAYRDFAARGFAPVRAEYEAALVLLGEHVTVSNLVGAVVAEGCVRGVSDEGELLVETAAGVTRAHAGEVTLRR